MFWHPFMSTGLGGPDDPRSPHDWDLRTERFGYWGRQPPSDVDEWLVQTVYEFIAARECCPRCGSPLHAKVRTEIEVFGPTVTWKLAVVTRCRGWRRHKQVAIVSRRDGNVMLGRFHVRGL